MTLCLVRRVAKVRDNPLRDDAPTQRSQGPSTKSLPLRIAEHTKLSGPTCQTLKHTFTAL